MDIMLDETEVRILGCLMEKEMTTPEYYPMSLNALTNACNQKSNRNPVVSYDETVVTKGLERMQGKNLARKTHGAGSRVPKYLHTVLDHFDLSKQEMAILCELLLRGPQTAGELRSHGERMSPFEKLEEVEQTLQGLMEHVPQLAIKLPRETGRKERRYMHLCSGVGGTARMEPDSADEPAVPPAQETTVRLEEEIAELRRELEELRQAFAAFKAQF